MFADQTQLTLVADSKKRYSRLPTSDPPPPPVDPASCPGVSILRPLRGLDCNLYENLEASFRQDYPRFELVFSVADEADAAIPIVRELQQRYPHVDSDLVIGQDTVGVNPKINNLIRPYRQAKHDLLWVLDSNVLTSPECLSRSVPLFGSGDAKHPVGLVHHVPFAVYPDAQLGSRVEQVYLCSTHAKMYLAINRVAVASCVTGKSCLYRKSDLERASELKRERGRLPLPPPGVTSEPGLAAFGQYLGEDNEIGVALWEELGMRHAMGIEVAGNAVGTMSFQTFFRRRVRWIRVRKYMVLCVPPLSPVHPILPSLTQKPPRPQRIDPRRAPHRVAPLGPPRRPRLPPPLPPPLVPLPPPAPRRLVPPRRRPVPRAPPRLPRTLDRHPPTGARRAGRVVPRSLGDPRAPRAPRVGVCDARRHGELARRGAGVPRAARRERARAPGGRARGVGREGVGARREEVGGQERERVRDAEPGRRRGEGGDACRGGLSASRALSFRYRSLYLVDLELSSCKTLLSRSRRTPRRGEGEHRC